MSTRLPHPVLLRLSAGTAMSLILWSVGAGQLAWLGFVLAALTAVPGRPDRAEPSPPSAPPTTSTSAPSRPPSGHYRLDVAETRISLTLRKLGVPVRSTVAAIVGDFHVGETLADSHGTVVIDLRSFRSRAAARDAHVRREIAAERLPETVRVEFDGVDGDADLFRVRAVARGGAEAASMHLEGRVTKRLADDRWTARLSGHVDRVALGARSWPGLVAPGVGVDCELVVCRQLR